MPRVNATNGQPPSSASPSERRCEQERDGREARSAMRLERGQGGAAEFPYLADASLSLVDRRQFLALVSAAMAWGAAGGCTRQPPEAIVPRVRQPEYAIPGRPRFFATAIPFRGFAQPVLVESHEGRPTRITGNPEHPASLGGISAITQAAIRELYDPDRAKVIMRRRQIATREALSEAIRQALDGEQARGGAGIRILSEPTTSPTLTRQMRAILERFPQARWHRYEPIHRDAVYHGTRLAFGRPLEPQYRFDQADVICSLDGDFLMNDPGSVQYARHFSDRRRVRDGVREMNRLYVAETSPGITGANADHRIAVRPDVIPLVARRLSQLTGAVSAAGTASGEASSEPIEAWLATVAADLNRHRGRGLVLAGDAQPACVHVAVHAINAALNNAGQTIAFSAPAVFEPADSAESLRQLVSDLEAGAVGMLLILGGNPAFDAPADVGFADAITKASLSIRLSLYEDETARACEWHVAESHALEAWSDLRSVSGLATIVQPLIHPLYRTVSAHELLNEILNDGPAGGLDAVRATWQGMMAAGPAEEAWRRAVHDGFVEGSQFPVESVALRRSDVETALAQYVDQPASRPATGGIGVAFRPHNSVWDGRHANNPWLWELPDPITKITWSNAALTGPQTAAELGMRDGQLIEVESGGLKISAPVAIAAHHAEGCISLTLGGGRRAGGETAVGTGFDAYAIRRAARPWFDPDVSVKVLTKMMPLARTQIHEGMEGRDLVRTIEIGRLEDALAAGDSSRGHRTVPLSLYAPHPEKHEAWGMSIDLTACIGCNACVIACQAENNIPVVGREEVRRGREMHWLRIDRYHINEAGRSSTVFQPLPCMHCENAPCEVVCPVGATVHSRDGLNEMVYNRCVGTRYCSNNCPYKVRRFNFFRYSHHDVEVLDLMQNPDVTVRSRGVMEKCTYCVQRISAARIAAKKEMRPIRDGEIETACQEVCPTRAIVFGNLNDDGSRVSRLKQESQDYGLLTELNTRPRTTYLPRFYNPFADPAETGDA